MTDTETFEQTLEQIKALPELDQEAKDETDEEEEWISTCATFLQNWMVEDAQTCTKPAVANLTLVCPFCGPRRRGKCEDHLAKGIASKLTCTQCSRKAKTNIVLHPLKCVWKDD